MMPTPQCDVSDSALCNVLSDIKQSISVKNYAGILAYQSPIAVTCDPDGMYIEVCEGVPKGVVKEGYGIGFNQSEGVVQTRDVHLASFSSYLDKNGPFVYKGSLQRADKGVMVYLNTDGSHLFVLYLNRVGATWRFQTILLGGTFGDTRYALLSPTLLD
jgi:hypothetical protein